MNLTVFRGKSFGQILDMNRGTGLGFDIVRLALAILILFSHTSGIIGTHGTITGIMNWIFQVDPHTARNIAAATALEVPGQTNVNKLTGLGRPVTLSYLPMFFALSGFLVTGSALRTQRLIPFLGLRVLRLLPALLVEVTLSAIILGSIFTTLPLSQYYSSAGFWNYFLNIIGHVQFLLPGVFKETGSAVVNANLWTLPWEFKCYIFMSTIIILGLLSKKVLLTYLYVVLTAGLLIASIGYDYQVVPAQLGGPTLVYYFLTGMIFFLWRDKIIFHEGIFLFAGVLSYAFMMSSRTVFVYPLLLTYVTMFIGLFPFRQFNLLKSGDYSYGIYLYGYPVTQSLVLTFPYLKTNLAVAAPVALIATAAFAWMSWHGVEKHCLKLKRHLSPQSAKINENLHPKTYGGQTPAPYAFGVRANPADNRQL